MSKDVFRIEICGVACFMREKPKAELSLAVTVPVIAVPIGRSIDHRSLIDRRRRWRIIDRRRWRSDIHRLRCEGAS
jgi:hypothetical protein